MIPPIRIGVQLCSRKNKSNPSGWLSDNQYTIDRFCPKLRIVEKSRVRTPYAIYTYDFRNYCFLLCILDDIEYNEGVRGSERQGIKTGKVEKMESYHKVTIYNPPKLVVLDSVKKMFVLVNLVK